MKKHYNISILTLCLLLIAGCIQAQDLVNEYTGFYQKIKSIDSYRLTGELEITDLEHSVTRQNVMMEQHKNHFFIQTGENEVIYTPKMVITMNEPFKSIMVTFRQDEQAKVDITEQFEKLKAQIDEGHTYTFHDGEEPYYQIEINDNVFDHIQLFFEDEMLVKVVTEYNSEHLTYHQSALKLSYDTEVRFKKSDFSIERYTYEKGGEFRLKEGYEHYDITIN